MFLASKRFKFLSNMLPYLSVLQGVSIRIHQSRVQDITGRMKRVVQKLPPFQNYILRLFVFRFGQSLMLCIMLLEGSHVVVHNRIAAGAFSVCFPYHTRQWLQQRVTVRPQLSEG